MTCYIYVIIMFVPSMFKNLVSSDILDVCLMYSNIFYITVTGNRKKERIFFLLQIQLKGFQDMSIGVRFQIDVLPFPSRINFAIISTGQRPRVSAHAHVFIITRRQLKS